MHYLIITKDAKEIIASIDTEEDHVILADGYDLVVEKNEEE